ncbi:MAG: DISARM system helicase DrmA, partial [Promethearchaeota archaeon]
MRKILIEELFKEVYGPRDGKNEEIKSDPLKEYITGVLIPKKCKKVLNTPDSEQIISGGDILAEDDNSLDEIIISIPSELDPKMRTRSCGLSFRISGKPILLKICLTWGRYETKDDENDENDEGDENDENDEGDENDENDEGDENDENDEDDENDENDEGDENDKNKVWKRISNYKILEVDLTNINYQKLLVDGVDNNGIFLYMKRISINNDISDIIIYLVNELDINKCYRNELTKKSIFQPSIRIRFNKDIRLISTNDLMNIENEENLLEDELQFLYREMPILARGFMCSAIWKEIDFVDHINQSIWWPDGYDVDECKEFLKSDVRTEFIPLYPIAAPIYKWNVQYRIKPELSPYKLSEMWENNEIDEYLSPIAIIYEKWIEENKKELKKFTEKKNTVINIINKQIEALNRIKDGIRLLKENKDIRLSFCFANRVIWLQNKWKGKNFDWRPFQLAYILLNIESIFNQKSKYRDYVDLLWIPTGGGKTEAYLALMAFTMALRRRNAILRQKKKTNNSDITGGGTAIITRYTLRLLTIQQFRRILRMVLAAEFLRVYKNNNIFGWRPKKCLISDKFIYGTMRFSIGLWVGGAVSPNHLRGSYGALKALEDGRMEGEPAQIIRCPVCDSWLAIPRGGLSPGKHELYFEILVNNQDLNSLKQLILSLKFDGINIMDIKFINDNHIQNNTTFLLSIESTRNLKAEDIDRIINDILKKISGSIRSIRPSRMGYFGYGREPGRRQLKYVDFEIFCNNPKCPLNKNDIEYKEGVPIDANLDNTNTKFPDGLIERCIEMPFKWGTRIPIPAYTVDEQVYSKCPTIVISTVDKIARLAFEPRAASLFGNIDKYHAIYGYYRDNLFPKETTQAARNSDSLKIEVLPFFPPELIIQDELHLINGPLGSMFGLYEMAFEGLMNILEFKPKYIASTATIKNADYQVDNIFARKLFRFPPFGIKISDSFFIKHREFNLGWNDDIPGRIYMGIYAPGMGPLTPLIRIWASLLKTANENTDNDKIKYFWTIVGYFNAIRELGGGVALYREDIVERINQISANNPRRLDPNKMIELSSRINSTDIPQLLDDLEQGINRQYNENPDAIFTTSMFGTGVDISNLSLMIMNGQPKTTDQYIQATGRVGREKGGLVVVLFKAGRPRDLSHYEMFIGYHHRINLDVEPVSVSPFSVGSLSRSLGPVMVSFLRNLWNPTVEWFKDDGKIIQENNADNDLKIFKEIYKRRIKDKIIDFEDKSNFLDSLI